MLATAFEPALPPHGGRFETLAVELHREAATLAAGVHPITLAAVADVVRVINSYYSNLIEGARTTPAEIEAALREDYNHDPGRAAVQRLAAAHVRIERELFADLAANSRHAITAPEFLDRLHAALYADVPESERLVRSATGRAAIVVPGRIREDDVVVGAHHAPPPSDVPRLLARFRDVYDPERLGAIERVVAFAASHHRLAWIHPYLDGNGRVARLFTTAYARRIGLDAEGLWSVARGFARYSGEYYRHLAAADEERRTDTDGRGPLSLRGLEEWCDFVGRVALDQIAYMRTLLVPATLAERLQGYAAYRGAASPEVAGGGSWRPEMGDLLAQLVWRGELARGEAMRYLPGRERTARALLATLLRDGIVTSTSHRAEIRLAFPAAAVPMVFPDLIARPTDAERQSPPAPAADIVAARTAIPDRPVPDGGSRGR